MTDGTRPEGAERADIVVDADREPRSEQKRPRRPRLLLTNDDGIESPGLRLLAQRLARSHDVVVVAPNSDRSGVGTGIGRFDPREGVRYERADLEGVEAYAIDGPPGLAVMATSLGAFGGRPDLVVSGINAGMNTGHSVIHSGTVGAALTARTFGGRGVAFSLAPSGTWRWETGVEVAESIVSWLLARPGGSLVLNVNVPAVAYADIKGVTWAELDEFGYFRVATTSADDARLSFQVGSPDSGRDPACDTSRCLDGFVTLTPLSTVESESVSWIAAEEVCRLRR